MSQIRVPLIIDRNRHFLELLLKEAHSLRSSIPLIYDSVSDAQTSLSSPNLKLLGVVVNPSIGATDTIQVIKACKQHRPTIPILFLQEGETPYDETMLKRLGVRHVLKKPVLYQTILSALESKEEMVDFTYSLDSTQSSINILALASNPSEMAKKQENQGPPSGSPSNSTAPVELLIQDQEFISVNARDFLDGSKSTFSLFLRLESGRYLKLLQAGDVMQKERLRRYLDRGVTLFYIKKKEHEKYLEYCDSLVADLIRMQTVPVNIKLTETLRFGEEAIKLYSHIGLRESNLHHASKFVENLAKVTKQVSASAVPTILAFLEDALAYDHGVATSFTASLLIQALEIFSSDPVETIGLACLFHDLGLKKLAPHLMDENENKMSDADKEVYRTHGDEGARLLKQIPGVKPAVIQGVEHHHVRRNKTGFPQLPGVGSLSLVSEIVGMSDEICHIMEEVRRNPSNMKVNFHNMCTLRIHSAFSHKMVSAFKKVFPKMAA